MQGKKEEEESVGGGKAVMRKRKKWGFRPRRGRAEVKVGSRPQNEKGK